MRTIEYSDGDLAACTGRGRDLAHHYDLQFIGSGDPQRHVDNLIVLYCTYLGRPAPRLVVSNIPFNQSQVYSMFVARDSDGNVDIVTARDLNPCWDRFVTAKELFHAILDAEEFRNMRLDEHVEDALVGWSAPQRSVVSEGLAEFAAMEFLFPLIARRKELAREGVKDFRAIAVRYRIPQFKVEQYLSEDYMERLGRIHDETSEPVRLVA